MSMSERTFVELLHDLGDVDGPVTDDRHDAIHHRIKRVQRRRTAFTAAAVVIVLLAAVLGVAFAKSTSHMTPTHKSMPTSWTAADGVVYQRIDLVTLDTGKQKSVTITVPASVPIAVRSTCDDSGETRPPGAQKGMLPMIGVGLGTVDPSVHQIDCHAGLTPVLSDFDVAAVANGTDRVRITLTGQPVGMGGGPEKVYPAKWTFGIYVWVVPAQLRTVPALPPMPPTIVDLRLAHTVSTTWPSGRSITFEIPAHTAWNMFIACSDTFAGATESLVGADDGWTITIGSDEEPGSPNCQGTQTVGEDQYHGAVAAVPQPTVVTITINYDAIYQQRSGLIEVGIYYQR